MRHGSLFAGVGGFDEGFRAVGMQVLWQVEKEPFCKAVLRSRFPEAELLSDVRDCGRQNLRAVDILTAGFPCQDLSVAGKRAGLGGARSGLFWEVVRILGELRPTWFVLENVPGLFSSNEGRDFAVVLNALDELGYGLAWRVLNSQFFGVAQRRRRVFIVGRFGKPCPAEVLFESESGGWDSQASGEERERIASTLTERFGGASNQWAPRNEADNPIVVNCLAPVGGGADDNDAQAGHLVAYNIHSAHSCAKERHAYESERTKSLDSTGAFASNQGGTVIGSSSNSHGVRDFTGLPQGLDSVRYRALGNAVTAKVAYWIGKRIIEVAHD